MRNHHKNKSMLILLFVLLMPFPLSAEEHVFMYPFKLTAQDALVDGASSNPIEIPGDSMLLWVDLVPNAFFAHPTLYVLISHTSATIVQGQWWPVLNGKRVLFDAPSNYTIISPFTLTSSTGTVFIYMYPFTLMRDDNLEDGQEKIDIQQDGTMLIWADLYPNNRFAHPTLYVLLSDSRSRVVRGSWWPVLNGKKIFDAGPNPIFRYTLISPFVKGTSGLQGTGVREELWKSYYSPPRK